MYYYNNQLRFNSNQAVSEIKTNGKKQEKGKKYPFIKPSLVNQVEISKYLEVDGYTFRSWALRLNVKQTRRN